MLLGELLLPKTIVAFVFVALAPSAGLAQTTTVGVQGTHLRLRAVGEGPLGVGFRGTFDVWRLGLDAETSWFPENPSGNFGERLWLAGGRVRVWSGRPALFARARAGRIAFEGAHFDGRLEPRRHPAFDVGVTIELGGVNWGRARRDPRPRHGVVARIDVGDLIVPFGGASYLAGPEPSRLGVAHSLAMTIGLAWQMSR